MSATEAAPESANAFPAAIAQIDRAYSLKVLALCSSPHSSADNTRKVIVGPWRHTADLEYIGPDHHKASMWPDFSMLSYMVHTRISIPPRSDSRSDPWVTVHASHLGNVTVPRGYRVPLLWLARVQWESLKLLLTVARPLWDLIKWDVMHLARMSAEFLGRASVVKQMKRQWRDIGFDRAMTRFFNGWMGCSDEFISDFYHEFRDEEYKDDLLVRSASFELCDTCPSLIFSIIGWAQKVPKGIQGFVITEQELVDGITADQFTAGLTIDREHQTYAWVPEPEVELAPADVSVILPPEFLSSSRHAAPDFTCTEERR